MIDRSKRHSFTVLPCALAVLCTLPLSVAATEEVQVGRYSSVRPVPTEQQINLLSALVTVRFPEKVATVGQAVDQLLGPSGYRLAPDSVAEPDRAALLALPLPEPHRSLGPMPLRTALETLAGPAFRLVEDPLRCAQKRPPTGLVRALRVVSSAPTDRDQRRDEVAPMEGLIALALVLGAYGLGTVTKAPRSPEKGPSAEVKHLPVTPAAVSSPPQSCRYFEGPLPQRDLTVPRASLVVGREGVDADGVTDSGDE